jgi:hypothetical protein
MQYRSRCNISNLPEMLYFLSIFIKEDQYKCQQICIFILQRNLNVLFDTIL